MSTCFLSLSLERPDRLLIDPCSVAWGRPHQPCRLHLRHRDSVDLLIGRAFSLSVTGIITGTALNSALWWTVHFFNRLPQYFEAGLS